MNWLRQWKNNKLLFGVLLALVGCLVFFATVLFFDRPSLSEDEVIAYVSKHMHEYGVSIYKLDQTSASYQGKGKWSVFMRGTATTSSYTAPIRREGLLKLTPLTEEARQKDAARKLLPEIIRPGFTTKYTDYYDVHINFYEQTRTIEVKDNTFLKSTQEIKVDRVDR